MTNDKLPASVERWLDEMFALLFTKKPKGGERKMTCPNCGEDMEYDETTGGWECPDCHYTENR